MTGTWPDLRLLVHAADRTGPPMLALALGRWVHAEHPELAIETVVFRGGPLEADFAEIGPAWAVLDEHEPWDGQLPGAELRAELAGRLASLAPATLTLLVSVAASILLPILPEPGGVVVTWAVEVGEDLHWLDEPVGLVGATDRWLAGSDATARDLAGRLPAEVAIGAAPEFVEPPRPVSAPDRANARTRLGGAGSAMVVVGAGIGTWRKGLDLFVEVAALHRLRSATPARFTWVGGERDPLPAMVAPELDRPGLDHVRLLPSVPDLDALLVGADVFLHPARLDAFPLVCIHAAACSVPVVAFTDAGGIGEMLGDAVLGAAYPAVDELVDVLVALEDPAVRREVAARQRAAVERFLAPSAAPIIFGELAVLAGWGS